MLNCSYQLKLGPNTCQISMKNDGLPCSRLQRLFMREFSKFQTDVIVTPLRDCDFFSRSTWLDMWLSYKYFHYYLACHFVGLDYNFFYAWRRPFQFESRYRIQKDREGFFQVQVRRNRWGRLGFFHDQLLQKITPITFWKTWNEKCLSLFYDIVCVDASKSNLFSYIFRGEILFVPTNFKTVPLGLKTQNLC